MSLDSPLSTTCWQLQREKYALASQNAELTRTARALSERCALLEAACCSRDAVDEAEEECCTVAEERADLSDARAAELETHLAEVAARASDAEGRAAASDERAEAMALQLAAAEARAVHAESQHEEVVAALMDARTALAQLRFEHDEASLAHRRRVADLQNQLQKLQSLQLSDCSRVATLEIQLPECERSKAALARECAARRQECEAAKAPRKPLAELANGAAAGGMRAFAERWQQEW